MPERQVVATMTFSDSVINVPIPPHNFVLKVPAGMKVQSLP
jgi:outer membrane lipoprotein-sorting protein